MLFDIFYSIFRKIVFIVLEIKYGRSLEIIGLKNLILTSRVKLYFYFFKDLNACALNIKLLLKLFFKNAETTL